MSAPNAVPGRAAGVLLHISSLPSRFGIGDVGRPARAFLEQLEQAAQSWWQILPLNPPACGNSPYSSYSAMAANPLLISLEDLQADGLLPRSALPPRSADLAGPCIDYAEVCRLKMPLLGEAFERFSTRPPTRLRRAMERFCDENRHWLDDYALFMALRESVGKPWIQWPAGLALRRRADLAAASRRLARETQYHRFLQCIFAMQFARLRTHAAKCGVGLIGDMPMFVSHDSADVWANRGLFELHRDGRPIAIAGVPPDLFCRTGQLWGNPLYNWRSMETSRFRWWVNRIRQALRDVDLLRIDHFRGLESVWRVPAGAQTARQGKWSPTPGRQLLSELRRQLHALPLIAEDLGEITPAVEALRDEFALPGMKVLQFACDGSPSNPHLPHNHVPNAIVYTGTHDNDTTLGWWQTLKARERKNVTLYLPAASRDPAGALIEAAMSSVARIAIIPLQDLLRKGGDARMNTPGRAEGNWQWRMRPNEWNPSAIRQLRDLTTKYGRKPANDQ